MITYTWSNRIAAVYHLTMLLGPNLTKTLAAELLHE